MLEKRWYPRNEDGTIITKKPCQTEGCNYPNYHLCLIGRPNHWRAAINREKAFFSSMGMGRQPGFVMDEEQRENIRAAMVAKFAARNELTKDRDREVLAALDSGLKRTVVAKQFDITPMVVKGILKRREQILS